MTNLEHLIENELCRFEEKPDLSYQGHLEEIRKDINYEDAGITEEQCYEICQYIYFTYIPSIMDEGYEIK